LEFLNPWPYSVDSRAVRPDHDLHARLHCARLRIDGATRLASADFAQFALLDAALLPIWACMGVASHAAGGDSDGRVSTQMNSIV
jgi:hypothetical protein